MKLIRKAGQTSVIEDIFIRDSSASTGVGLAGLTNASGGLKCYYKRKGQSSWTAVSLVSATTGTWTSGGFKEGDATNAKGMYELHLPNAVVAAGVESVAIKLQGATNMADLPIEIELVPWDPQDVVRGGFTCFPNVAQGNAGALPTGDASGNVIGVSGVDFTMLKGFKAGTVNDAGPTTAGFNGSAGLSATDHFYEGCVMVFTGGANAGIGRRVTGYTGATKAFTFASPWTTAPANTDPFFLVGRID